MPVPATATPAPVAVRTIKMAAPPLVLDVEQSSTRTYVADSAGLIWTLDDGEPTLQAPINVGGRPTGLAIDERANRLYIGVRSPPTILVVDAGSGQRIATLPLPVAPGGVRVDAELSLLYVVLPEAQSLAAINTNTFTIQHAQSQLADITGIAHDPYSHTLYLSHENGELSIVGGQAAETIDRLRLTDGSLSGVATAHGQVYAINTPGRELVELDPGLREAAHVALSDEPIALSASQSNGDIYILTGQSDAVVRISAVTGQMVARAELQGGSSGPASMAINQVGDTVYVAPSTQGGLAVLAPETFGLRR
jgi:DNA-binding beta-propeller fold protein YncE